MGACVPRALTRVCRARHAEAAPRIRALHIHVVLNGSKKNDAPEYMQYLKSNCIFVRISVSLLLLRPFSIVYSSIKIISKQKRKHMRNEGLIEGFPDLISNPTLAHKKDRVRTPQKKEKERKERLQYQYLCGAGYRRGRLLHGDHAGVFLCSEKPWGVEDRV